MNNKRLIELLRGYAIFFLCLFIFTMWGINLLSISQTDVETKILDPKEPELVESGSIKNFSFKPRPFLYFYFRELGFDMDICKGSPTRNDNLVVIIDPPPSIDQQILRELFTWVRKGGNLLLFMPSEHQIDRLLGISRQTSLEPIPDYLALRLPYLNEIETISPTQNSVHRSGGMSFFSVFPEYQGGSTVFISGRGAGRLIIMAHPDFISGNGLKKQDNIILVTRMVESLAGKRSFSILDTEPALMMQARIRTMIKKPATITAKIKKDHLSFYSLLKANPISWVLLQMILALTVLFAVTARRFGSPLTLPDQETGTTSYIMSMGQLLAEKGDATFALSEVLSEFAVLAIKRYGLRGKAPLKEIIAAIRQGNVEVADDLSRIEGQAYQILNGEKQSPAALLRVVRTIERARKELKLYD